MSDLYQQGMEIVNQLPDIHSRQAKVDRAELMSAGMEGLMEGVSKYNPKSGNFKPFCRKCIDKHISRRIGKIKKDKDRLVSLTNLPERLHPVVKIEPPDPRVDEVLRIAGSQGRRVLRLIMQGYKQQEIAGMLGCHRNTIVGIISKVRRKCQVK